MEFLNNAGLPYFVQSTKDTLDNKINLVDTYALDEVNSKVQKDYRYASEFKIRYYNNNPSSSFLPIYLAKVTPSDISKPELIRFEFGSYGVNLFGTIKFNLTYSPESTQPQTTMPEKYYWDISAFGKVDGQMYLLTSQVYVDMYKTASFDTDKSIKLAINTYLSGGSTSYNMPNYIITLRSDRPIEPLLYSNENESNADMKMQLRAVTIYE